MVPFLSSLDPIPRAMTAVAACLALSCCVTACGSESSENEAPVCGPGFATSVVSVRYGDHAGFGQDRMPSIVLGPPQGGGELQGSTDVVTLGVGGEIVLGFSGSGIEDGPGADFIVFENAFYAGGDLSRPFVDPGEVSVSEDGTTWVPFPCDAKGSAYAGCAGAKPVLSQPSNGIAALDPSVAGGDAFDLASIGVAKARYVRIQDRSSGGTGVSAGFDLDAVGVIHAACP